ncbi:MAG: hypothetical protein QG641_612, partial [Candidatus Poribacteria bacterium]|nr:hypothetical protein [Candidatus Poribacteria bacterium]
MTTFNGNAKVIKIEVKFSEQRALYSFWTVRHGSSNMEKLVILVLIFCLFLSCSFCLILAGCSQQERDARNLIQMMSAPDPSTKDRMLEELVTVGTPAVKPLINALKDEDPEIQCMAIIALAKIRDSHSVEPLITALENEGSDIRKKVAMALGEIGDPRAVKPLIAVLRDKDLRVREWAISALGETNDPRVVEALIITLKDKDTRDSSVWALEKMYGRNSNSYIADSCRKALITALRSDLKFVFENYMSLH